MLTEHCLKVISAKDDGGATTLSSVKLIIFLSVLFLSFSAFLFLQTQDTKVRYFKLCSPQNSFCLCPLARHNSIHSLRCSCVYFEPPLCSWLTGFIFSIDLIFYLGAKLWTETPFKQDVVYRMITIVLITPTLRFNDYPQVLITNNEKG